MGQHTKQKIGLLVFVFFTMLPFAAYFRVLAVNPVHFPNGISSAIYGSLVQASLSGLVTVLFGLVLALGLTALPSRLRVAIEGILLMPFFLPALFSLNFCLFHLNAFPYGKWGIVIVHVMMNLGFVSITLARAMEDELSPLTELAYVEGASRWRTLIALRNSLIKMSASAFVFVFSICMTSFLIPLVAGGGKWPTLEVLLFERAKEPSTFSDAVFLALIQLFILSCVLFVSQFFKRQPRSPGRKNSLYILPMDFLMPLILCLVGAAAFFFCSEIVSSLRTMLDDQSLLFSIWDLLPNTLWFGSGVVFVSIALFVFMTWFEGQDGVHHWLGQGSPMLLAIGVMLLPGSRDVKFIYIMSLMSFFPLWRLWGRPAVESLRRQIEMSRLIGASDFQWITEIALPQMRSELAKITSIAFIWTIGDYAIGKLILAEEKTLGIMAGNLMSSYRSLLATTVILLILILGGLFYLVISGVTRVGNSQPST